MTYEMHESGLLLPTGMSRKKAMTERIAGPEAAGVRTFNHDHPGQGATPGTLASILKDGESYRPERFMAFAEDMEEKEPQYLAVLGSRKRAVSQLEITVEPASDSAEHKRHAEFIEAFTKREELEDEFFDMLDAIGKGISVTEIVWETSEKEWMPKALHYVDPTWLEFDQVDLTTPMIRTMDGPLRLTSGKFIPLTIKAKSGIPGRAGVARAVSWCWMFKNFDIKSWVQFLEVFGQPVRVGKFGTGATDAEKRELLRTVVNLGRNFAGVIPRGMDVEFIQAGGASSNGALFQDLAEYLDKQISKIVLGQTMTTDDGSSRSQAEVHNEVREDIERSDARKLAAAINKHLVAPTIDFNFGPQTAYPKVLIGRAEHVDLDKFTSMVTSLKGIGLKISAKQVYAKTGLEEPVSKDDILGGENKPGGEEPNTPGAQPSQKPATSTGNQDAEDPEDGVEEEDAIATAAAVSDPDTVDRIVDQVLASSHEAMMSPIKDAVLALGNNVDTFDEFIDRLPELLGTDLSREIVSAMTPGLFAARAGASAAADLEPEEAEAEQ